MKGNVLIVAGGGSRGCFSGGYLYGSFKKQKYNKIVGCSVGSLNALMLAQCYIDKSPELLKHIWTKVITKNSSVYKKNYLKTLLLKAPYSLSPLRKLIKQYADLDAIIKSDVEIILTTCDLITGESKFLSSKNMNSEELLLAILGSATIPPAFPAINLNEMQLVDGGLRDNIPIKAIEINGNQNITIVLCNPIKMKISPKKYKNIFKISSRSIDIILDECMQNDLSNILLIDEILKISNKKLTTKASCILKNKKPINAKIIMPGITVTESTLEFKQEELIKGFHLGEYYI